MHEFCYSVCGLNLRSEFECPELASAPGAGYGSVIARIGAVRSGILNDGATPSKGYFGFSAAGIARYEVLRGEEIVVEPEPDADRSSVRLFLLSAGLGAVLHQRGTAVLHGSCVVAGGGAVVFAGASGAGKSALAAGFLSRGYQILADEISALQISDSISVFPGPNGLMVWSDVLGRLPFGAEHLAPVRPQTRKYLLPLGSAHERKITPVRKIYILETSPEDSCRVIPVQGIGKFKSLSENIYRRAIVASMGLAGSVAPLIAQVAGKVEVSRLVRPRNRFALDDLMDTVERDLA